MANSEANIQRKSQKKIKKLTTILAGITTRIYGITFYLTCSPQYTKWFEQLRHSWSPIFFQIDIHLVQFSKLMPSPTTCLASNEKSQMEHPSYFSNPSLIVENNPPSLHLDINSLPTPTRGHTVTEGVENHPLLSLLRFSPPPLSPHINAHTLIRFTFSINPYRCPPFTTLLTFSPHQAARCSSGKARTTSVDFCACGAGIQILYVSLPAACSSLSAKYPAAHFVRSNSTTAGSLYRNVPAATTRGLLSRIAALCMLVWGRVGGSCMLASTALCLCRGGGCRCGNGTSVVASQCLQWPSTIAVRAGSSEIAGTNSRTKLNIAVSICTLAART